MTNVHSNYIKNIAIEPIVVGTLGWLAPGDLYVIYTSDRSWVSLTTGDVYMREAPIRILPRGTSVTLTVG